jgi:hypothetical protein
VEGVAASTNIFNSTAVCAILYTRTLFIYCRYKLKVTNLMIHTDAANLLERVARTEPVSYSGGHDLISSQRPVS